MHPLNQPIVVMADDDEEDCFLVKKALSRCNIPVYLDVVSDGSDLIEYLARKVPVQNETVTLPIFILLDLNMPKKNGYETLKEIRKDDKLKKIPIIVFTTSKDEENVETCYELGANSYISKPSNFDLLEETMQTLLTYWLQTARVPGWHDRSIDMLAVSN